MRITLVFFVCLAGCSTCPSIEVPKPVPIEKRVQIPFADSYFESCSIPDPLRGSITNGELLENYAALKTSIDCLLTRLDTLKKENDRLK